MTDDEVIADQIRAVLTAAEAGDGTAPIVEAGAPSCAPTPVPSTDRSTMPSFSSSLR